MSIDKKQSSYFFACGFAWWAVHIFFQPFEEPDVPVEDDLLDHMDAFDEHAEDLAQWLRDELMKPDIVFVNNGEVLPIQSCLVKYESNVKEWVDELHEAAKARSANDKQYDCLYCLLLGWELQILNALEEFIEIGDASSSESRQHGKELMNGLRTWLQQELTTAPPHFLKISKEELLDTQVQELYRNLENKWRRLVHEATETHTLGETSQS